MKKTIIALIAAVGLSSVAFAAETKKVCQVDSKTKKEVCKTIKIHKKLDGTPVPAKK